MQQDRAAEFRRQRFIVVACEPNILTFERESDLLLAWADLIARSEPSSFVDGGGLARGNVVNGEQILEWLDREEPSTA